MADDLLNKNGSVIIALYGDNILNTTSLASNKTATIVVRDYTSDVIYDLTTQSSGSIIIVKETTGTLTSNNTITVTTD